MMKTISFLFFSLLLASPLVAIPNSIQFQGRLTDSNGDPISGEPQVRFVLYDAEEGGALLWETDGFVRVRATTSGLFSTEMGPLPADLFATNDDVYMEVIVRGPAGPRSLKPRQKLRSVAFAFESATSDLAETARSLTPNSLTDAMVQEGALTSRVIADGSIGPDDIADGAIQTRHFGGAGVDGDFLSEGILKPIHFSTYAVTSAGVANDSLLGEDLVTDSVSTREIAEGAVTAEQIAPSAVGVEHLNPEVFVNFLPTGMVAMFDRVCPTGWSYFTPLENRFPIGVSPERYDGVPGGSRTIEGLTVTQGGDHSHPLLPHAHGISAQAGHSHSLPQHRHDSRLGGEARMRQPPNIRVFAGNANGATVLAGGGELTGSNRTNPLLSGTELNAESVSGGAPEHNHGGSTAPGSSELPIGGLHAHNVESDGSWLPPYLGLVPCRKD